MGDSARIFPTCIFRRTCTVAGHAQQNVSFSERIRKNDILLRIIRARSEGREKRQELIFGLKSLSFRAERFQLIQRPLFACQIRFNVDMRRLDAFVAQPQGNYGYIDSRLQQMRPGRVPDRMRVNALAFKARAIRACNCSLQNEIDAVAR